MTKKQILITRGMTMINNSIIYDPYLIPAHDLRAAFPDCKLVAVRRPGWGKYNTITGAYTNESSTD